MKHIKIILLLLLSTSNFFIIQLWSLIEFNQSRVAHSKYNLKGYQALLTQLSDCFKTTRNNSKSEISDEDIETQCFNNIQIYYENQDIIDLTEQQPQNRPNDSDTFTMTKDTFYQSFDKIVDKATVSNSSMLRCIPHDYMSLTHITNGMILTIGTYCIATLIAFVSFIKKLRNSEISSILSFVSVVLMMIGITCSSIIYHRVKYWTSTYYGLDLPNDKILTKEPQSFQKYEMLNYMTNKFSCIDFSAESTIFIDTTLGMTKTIFFLNCILIISFTIII